MRVVALRSLSNGHISPLVGMQIVERIYSGYREDPKQNRIQTEGNQYLNDNFPMLSYITSTVGAPHNDDSWISEVWVVMVAIAGAF
jgi:hypothetical protein